MIAKVHMYNVTPIKWAGYKAPNELWDQTTMDTSNLRVFRCLAGGHILKKRRHKLKPKG